jgi:hypothetical protein
MQISVSVDHKLCGEPVAHLRRTHLPMYDGGSHQRYSHDAESQVFDSVHDPALAPGAPK